jgi:hypothetical protein
VVVVGHCGLADERSNCGNALFVIRG